MLTRFLTFVVFGLLLFFALRFLARRAAYHPLRYPIGLYSRQNEVGASDVWLTSSAGRLHAWWIPVSGARLATLYLHGNGGNLTHRVLHMRDIPAAGSSLLILDYRGYGRSDGTPSESGLYEDAAAAYDWLARAHDPKSIVIHGESLGTAVAVELASRKDCAGVVLEAPFNSASAVAALAVPLVGPMLMRDFNTRSRIAKLRAPVLFIHGDRDRVIPIALGRDLFAAAREPKSFWTVAGADHNDILDVAGPEYGRRLAAFYDSLARGPE
jgi:fermentation-respiration switch protein FrsA (DUF1100 family)